MLLVLSDRHKQDLAFFRNVPVEVLAEFAKLSLEFLRNGSNPKAYVGAARKLEVSPEAIQTAVEALSYIFAEASKASLSDADFTDSLAILGYPQEIANGLQKLFTANRKDVREILDTLTLDLPRYQSLEWRLDVQVASRAMNRQVNPVFTLRLETNEPTKHVRHLQLDYPNLLHLCSELETAQNELKTSHCRRIIRNVK